MQRNLFLALALAIAISFVYIVLPAPMRCHSQGCAADIAGRWNAHSPTAHIVRFLFVFGGMFAVFQWIAPWTGRVRHRARMRMWHGDREA
jgi:hypothetical protein